MRPFYFAFPQPLLNVDLAFAFCFPEVFTMNYCPPFQLFNLSSSSCFLNFFCSRQILTRYSVTATGITNQMFNAMLEIQSKTVFINSQPHFSSYQSSTFFFPICIQLVNLIFRGEVSSL